MLHFYSVHVSVYRNILLFLVDYMYHGMIKKSTALLVLCATFLTLIGPLEFSMTPQAYASFSNVFEGDTTISLPFQTGAIRPKKAFTSYVVSWEEDGFTPTNVHSHDNEGQNTHVIFSVRTYTNKGWSPWEELEKDYDTSDSLTGKNYTGITFTEPATKVQLVADRGSMASSIALSYLEVITFGEDETASLSLNNVANAANEPLIVSRGDWGASDDWVFFDTWGPARDGVCKEKPWYCTSTDAGQAAVRKKHAAEVEKYPFDTTVASKVASVNGRELMWSVSKSDHISKLFVHHTANINKDQNGDGVITQEDEMIALRSIYYFHSVVRGWGDIGYNFMVGPTGTIYEGRYGGDFAVGAHAVWRNTSSMGVSLLGNFEEESLSAKQKSGTAKILAYLSHKYGLTPNGQTSFYGQTLPTILGHRDSAEASTACPGKNVYVTLDTIRELAQTEYSSMTGVAGGSTNNVIISGGYSSSYIPTEGALNLKAGEQGTISIKLLNTGEATWDASTYLRVDNGEPGFTILSGKGTRAKAAYARDQITPPGATATFDLIVQNTYEGFSGNLQLTPFGGGLYAMNSFVLPIQLAKGSASYSKSLMQTTPSNPMVGEDIAVQVQLKNTGSSTWDRTGVRRFYLSLYDNENTGQALLDDIALVENTVSPGATGTFHLTLPAKYQAKTYTYNLIPRVSGINSLLGTPVSLSTTVLHPAQAGMVLSTKAQRSYELDQNTTQELTFVVHNSSNRDLKNLSQYDLSSTINKSGHLYFDLGKPYFLEEHLRAGGDATLVVPVTSTQEKAPEEYSIDISLGESSLLQISPVVLQVKPLILIGQLLHNNFLVDTLTKKVVLTIKNTGGSSWNTQTLQPGLLIGNETVPLTILSKDQFINMGELLHLALPLTTNKLAFQGTITVKHTSGTWLRLEDGNVSIVQRTLQDYIPGARWFFGR